VLAESDPMIGTGRALPHKGLSELHPWSTREASSRAPRGSEKARILFIWDRTTDGGYGVLLLRSA
jgi:hypothetical protein